MKCQRKSWYKKHLSASDDTRREYSKGGTCAADCFALMYPKLNHEEFVKRFYGYNFEDDKDCDSLNQVAAYARNNGYRLFRCVPAKNPRRRQFYMVSGLSKEGIINEAKGTHDGSRHGVVYRGCRRWLDPNDAWTNPKYRGVLNCIETRWLEPKPRKKSRSHDGLRRR